MKHSVAAGPPWGLTPRPQQYPASVRRARRQVMVIAQTLVVVLRLGETSKLTRTDNSERDGPLDLLPAQIEPIKALLAEVQTIPEVKEIRDRAEAARKYIRSANMGLEAQNQCAEIKLLAERKAGELLKEMADRGDRKSRGGDSAKLHGETLLCNLGISKTQSHRWQSIAWIPADIIEREVEETRKSGLEITSSHFVSLAKQMRKKEKQAKAREVIDVGDVEGVVPNLKALLDQGAKFPCIYADPPWQYDNQGTRAATDNHYQTMSINELCAMPVASVAADYAHLHLWTTNAFLFDAKHVIEAWGFEFKSCFVWVKPQMGIGNYWRVSHEFLLLGVRGSLQFNDKGLKSWGEYRRGRHSSKPEAVRGLIERVSAGPRLELFGRERVKGWTVLGNQVSPQGRLL